MLLDTTQCLQKIFVTTVDGVWNVNTARTNIKERFVTRTAYRLPPFGSGTEPKRQFDCCKIYIPAFAACVIGVVEAKKIAFYKENFMMRSEYSYLSVKIFNFILF